MLQPDGYLQRVVELNTGPKKTNPTSSGQSGILHELVERYAKPTLCLLGHASILHENDSKIRLFTANGENS